MHSYEAYISSDSHYYMYSPSQTGATMFLYPLCIGHFHYEEPYYLKRSSYPSYLLMYIPKGSFTLVVDSQSLSVHAGDFVLLDCYAAHCYYANTCFESIWCHFDGPTARAQYDFIHTHLGTVFRLNTPYSVINKLQALLHIFQTGTILREPILSKYLTDILTSLHLESSAKLHPTATTTISQEIITYINEHINEQFAKPLSITDLANRVGLSKYHFIRTFKKETGYTPHEYIIQTRMNTAKYLLRHSSLSVKDICFQVGYGNESVFCSAFKKSCGMRPMEYRNELNEMQ